MTTRYLDTVFEYVREQHPRSLRGIEEARAVSPERFECIAEMFLTWLVRARGEEGIRAAVDAFVQFTMDVNLAQARFEADGHYANKSFAQVYSDHYSQNESMSGYLWGIYLTNFLWAHHTEISLFYKDFFLSRLSDSSALVEIAPGHGGWGVWALSELPKARLHGFDISPSSIHIATRVSEAAGVAQRASYSERNALDLQQIQADSADGVICSFLVEHLEQPQLLFTIVHHLLRHRGIAFITGALTAAQVDHIYEYHYESELVRHCEENGLRVLATLSAAPRRILSNAHFLPRSMALIVQKRINDIF
jgi:ubiquinone/menaquinone biosynthesis C-methylase UbiE